VFDKTFEIEGKMIGLSHPVYFIADIAANHDGSLDRAKYLIELAKNSGADAAKFQHFQAEKIVSDFGFRNLKDPNSHQAKWKKSVYEIYKDFSVPRDWTPILKRVCDDVGIAFLSTPYDFESADLLDPYVPAYKIGSGDIDWSEFLIHICKKNKPIILATGASSLQEVEAAVSTFILFHSNFALLQCNTNYTAEEENFRHLNLRVINDFKRLWPGRVVGLSDHTRGLAAVLGAVSLGARIIERHFTDDSNREGPDHRFATDPAEWKLMVKETRRLELSLGTEEKRICENEVHSVVVQRRCVRAATDLTKGASLLRSDLVVLRPATVGSIKPDEIEKIIGRTLRVDKKLGQELRWSDFN